MMTALASLAALLRGLHVAALVSLAGTLLYSLTLLPAGGEVTGLRSALHRLAGASILIALVAGIAWVILETAALADANSLAMTLQAVPKVALRTQFGHCMLARLALLVLMLLLQRHVAVSLALAGVALALQPLLGHAGAIGGNAGIELSTMEALHLLAAGAWLGGLLPLFLAVRLLPNDAAVAACRGFTAIGLPSVLVLAATAVVQTATLMGSLPGLLGTPYGHVALVKLGLLLALLTLAAFNRFVFTEHLAFDGARGMRWSIAAELAIGTLVIITAGFLASLTPGMHEQPVWPLPWRLSPWAFADPSTRKVAIIGIIAAVAGAAIAIAGLMWRRIRWPALSVGAIILAAGIPELGGLFVPAYPTSFFTSPTEFAATAIAHGARLFAANCLTCHGSAGHGDGPAAKSLPLPPADLTAAHFRTHEDGDLYWYISHGFSSPEGAQAMPGFGHILSSEAIWDVIDFLRAHNAGYALRQIGQWPQPVPVPLFDVQCANGQVTDLDDLRGRMLRIVAVSDDERPDVPLPGDPDVTTILVMRNARMQPPGAACIASEPQVWTALATLVGSPDTLAGTQVLVDRSGWLRAVWRPGDAEDWVDPRVLSMRVREILTRPLANAPPMAHMHH
jgi:putative copper export protein/mono/diheme cytochrome c family protein